MTKTKIPGWSVQQAYPIESHPLKEGEWFAMTEKLNGVRATWYKGELIGRNGTILTGLDHIKKEISQLLKEGFVLDGELTLKDKTGLTDNEAFRKAAGIINSDAPEKPEIMFTVFDGLREIDFINETSPSYKFRQLCNWRFWILLAGCGQNVRPLSRLYEGTDQSVIPTLLDKVTAAGGEGLMINRDVPYLRRRHSGILKVKRFYTMDLPILRVEEGKGRCAGMAGHLVVSYKGNEVGVGTGMTQAQRRWLWAHRDEVVGALAEVKYKELSQDKQTGLESLQFPVFVRLRDDKSEVSYG